MRFILCLFLSLFFSQYSQAAEPAVYFVDVGADNRAVLYSTEKMIEQTKPLPFVGIDTGKSACCFVFGAPKRTPREAEANENGRVLVSDGDEKIYQFVGKYKPAVRSRSHEDVSSDLAFGLAGMASAKMVGRDALEISVTGQASKVILRQCLDGEGIRLKLFHSLKEKQPYASYYLLLGFEVEPDCKF
jgi:hypothetical protein